MITQHSCGGEASTTNCGNIRYLRVGLAAIDIAEPYIRWTNRASIPAEVAAGEPFTVQWQVRGCFEVDDTHVRYGTDPDPLTTFSGQTASQQQTGTPCFETPTLFTAEVSIPTAGTTYLTPLQKMRLDSNRKSQLYRSRHCSNGKSFINLSTMVYLSASFKSHIPSILPTHLK